MCNLYRMVSNVEAIRRLFGVGEGGFANLPTFPEIYPGHSAPVVRTVPSGRELVLMRWGFPPPPNTGTRPVTNVRNLASPFWRSALSRPDRRCLVPVTAFAEWEGEKGRKRKVWFEPADGEAFAFAGIWRQTPEGDAMAFLTCAPNRLVSQVHPKAMPVILAPAAYQSWLADPLSDVAALASPCSDEWLNIARA